MQNFKKHIGLGILLIYFATSCNKTNEFASQFCNTNDRIWIGKEYFAVPLEDWKVDDGHVKCIGLEADSRVNLLTHTLSAEPGNFETSVKVSLSKEGNRKGSAGLIVGAFDDEDPDVRAACFFGNGIKAGISLKGYAFLGKKQTALPQNFNFKDFIITVEGNDNNILLEIKETSGNNKVELKTNTDGVRGIISFATNMIQDDDHKDGNANFSFRNFKLSGSKVAYNPENVFGPILFTQYTLSKETLKLMTFLPPLGPDDNQSVSLQFKKNNNWKTALTKQLEPDSRTVVFKIENWDSKKDTEYRVKYVEKSKDNTETINFYYGSVKKNPVNMPLKLGAFTCQYTSAYPYTPLVKIVKSLDPDLLYFSGDQVYEPNGGYNIKREPEDMAILNYLGKYYLFGWAFGDLMRDCPTIITPDDHEVFQGNLWGEGGEAMPEGQSTSDSPGFKQTPGMINVVNRTQCGHLPDPYDPTPIKQEISVWYTSLNYGRISFAIVNDRVFKTGPQSVAFWNGRKDMLKNKLENPSVLNRFGLKMLGDRQMLFLKNWITDWEGADMKVLLSQTLYTNVATHTGSLETRIFGDLDSGGWPKSARDKVLRLMRKGAVFHINGDQHLASLVQYGIDDFRDAGWSFCTPAISNYHVRWFLPDELNMPVIDRPEHGYPNTGKYVDGFGNKNFVYAVGNPGKIVVDNASRYKNAYIRASGFGFVTFNPKERSIDMDCWRFMPNVENPNPYVQFPGWPYQISQFDNLGMGAKNILPKITVNKPNQLVQIWNEKTGELEQVFRIHGTSLQPHLFHRGSFTIKIGKGNNSKEIKGLKTVKNKNTQEIHIEI